MWIENDGKCAALAELWKGNLSDVENGVVIEIDTEISGRIISMEHYIGEAMKLQGSFQVFLQILKTPITKRGSAK